LSGCATCVNATECLTCSQSNYVVLADK
jgi:hypothetical protein